MPSQLMCAFKWRIQQLSKKIKGQKAFAKFGPYLKTHTSNYYLFAYVIFLSNLHKLESTSPDVRVASL